MIEPSLHDEASRILGRAVSAATAIGGGGNSRVYRIDAVDGSRFALKRYFRDDRGRLAVEFHALQFLSAVGVREVPAPIAADESAGIGVYEFIDGEPAMAAGPVPDDVAAAVAFARLLRDLSRRREAAALPVASEASFSLRALGESLECRVRRLEALVPEDASGADLQRFLRTRFRPALTGALDAGAQRLRRAGVDTDHTLDPDGRTLSPSDFGFHNAIRSTRGLVFVDFEYFGWDDPVKLSADFLLHPAMSLSELLKRQFLRGMFECFAAHDPGFEIRFAACYPLFALKWVLIVLNEFLPDQLLRRRFAADPDVSAHELRLRQLRKAETILAMAATEPVFS